jgi:MFS family permease
MPSNCKDQIKEQIIDKFTDDSDLYYNYFYLVYSWTNMIMSLCAGLMVDKLGKEKSMYLFVFFCLFGSAVYAGGTAMTNSDPKLQYGVMFFGRFIFGLGGGPITIVQNVYTATHFKSHNLALAFGCTLTVSRVGSVINFSLTPAIYKFIENHISETCVRPPQPFPPHVLTKSFFVPPPPPPGTRSRSRWPSAPPLCSPRLGLRCPGHASPTSP